MSDATTISVNFAKPIPVFPLDSVTLLPQQVLPLHIFEPRYRQMVEHVLDGAGQIAMAVFRGERWKQEYHGRPPLRPCVCIGQIIQHERLADGRYNLLLQGVCRARIVEESPPSAERLFREAMLQPLSTPHAEETTPELDSMRRSVGRMLTEGPLTHFAAAEAVAEYADDEDVPTNAFFELIAFTLISDPEVRYRLLAEADALRRVGVVQDELKRLESLLRRAERQHPEQWPKGCSWN